MSDIPPTDARQQRLMDAVVSLTQSFREERDRLARRLTELEGEIDALAVRLDQSQFPEVRLPAAPPPGPSRTRS